MARISFDPATADHATPKFTVGGLYDAADGNTYRYVKFVDVGTVAISAGSPLMAADATKGVLTADISASDFGAAGLIDGVAVHTPTANYYGFALVNGHYAGTYTTDGTGDAGNGLIISADNVYTVATGALTYRINCYAVADDATTTGTGMVVRCL